MVRKTSNEALCSPFIANALVQKQYEHFSFPTSGNLSGRQISRRWPDVGPSRADVGPTSGHIGRADVGKYPSRLP